jgi:hypothetical protein
MEATQQLRVVKLKQIDSTVITIQVQPNVS